MKKFQEKSLEEKFLDKLLKNEDLEKQKEVVGSFFKKPIWWTLKSAKKTPAELKKIFAPKCNIIKRPTKQRRMCFKSLASILKRAKKTKKTVKFSCPGSYNGFCLPIVQGDKVYGYIGLCQAEAELPDRPLQLFVNFIDTLIKEIQKELELSRLYETIRPRAIALSTVHTIHRLISSTLDLDELLPRIGRLTMQVVQANRCSVKLMNEERNTLMPVATIDMRTKRKLYPKELKLGKGIPGKAAKTATVLRGRDFISVPMIDEEVMGVITVYDKINHKPFTQLDQEIMMTIAEQAVIAIKNAQLYREQENLAISSIKSLAAILDTRGPAAFIPTTAFVKIVLEVGKEIGLSQSDLRSLHYAALLHDAGQMFIPNEVLLKSSKLTGDEYNMIREHPEKGAKIFEPTKYLKPVVPIILHHHENYDGTGYPNKLKGNQIPIGAKIMSIVSAFLAMITPRPYRVTKTIPEALEEIKRNSGTQFDPRVTSAFLKIIQKGEIQHIIEEEYNHGSGQAPKDSDIF